jgi:hypothetical protein
MLMTLPEDAPDMVLNYHHAIESIKVLDQDVNITSTYKLAKLSTLSSRPTASAPKPGSNTYPTMSYSTVVSSPTVPSFPKPSSHIFPASQMTPPVYRRNAGNVFRSRIALGQYGVVLLIRETPILSPL